MQRIALYFLLIVFTRGFSQVNCDLAYERTLQTFNVYIHNPSGATMYRAKMYIDADGSPRAYGPNNSGLDWTANAGYTGNWWALVTDASGNPIIQGASDPYPGMYVSTTSLVDSHYGTTNPLRYVNSETVPFIAMPTNVLASGNIHVGDVAYVYNTVTKQSCFAIYADAGNTTSIGEGSIYLATQIGVNANVRTGGTSLGIIDYVVFPQSGFGQGYIPTIAQIDSIGNLYLNSPNVGGACIVACLGTGMDTIAPTTWVATPSGWDTTAFTTNFTDADSGCLGGVAERFYQVSDLNVSDWRANDTRGFFNEDFNGPAIHPDWTQSAGTWAINAGNYLEQTDQTSANTNIYAPLTQNLSDSYLYSWTGTMGGSGTNRRAGFHFFADQPDSSNRGNSYFVWFRLDNDKIQVYEVVNNSWGANPVMDTAYNFTANQAYDFKVIYNRITGRISVYVNGSKSAEWTDTTPLSNGSYISFRNANCTYQVDNFKVFRSRSVTENIAAGAGNSNDLRYENQNPASPAGKISSIVVDSAGNMSAINVKNIDVDFTHPLSVVISDGAAADIDTTYNGSQLQGNWTTAVDPNSGIVNYYYAIGTTPGGTDVVGWTNNGASTAVTATGLALVHQQEYYISVQAEDGALMRSPLIISNGQLYFNSATGIDNAREYKAAVSVYPNPTEGQFTISCNQFSGETKVVVSDMVGREVLVKTITGSKAELDLSGESPGLYYLHISSCGKLYRAKVQVSH